MHQDKRATPRIEIHDNVTLRVAGELGSSPCTLDNISQGGLRFFATRELQEGSRVELRIASPEGEPDIALKARILRVSRSDGALFDYACRLDEVDNA